MSITPKPTLTAIKTLKSEEGIVPDTDVKPNITVIGVGGAGGNAVNNMINSNLEGVDFICGNTDAQALKQSLAKTKLQLGLGLTKGLGAGSRPDVGRAAAEESIDEILSYIKDTNMLFITAGMGGGTGTGAAPVIAHAAKELGILTVGVVTKPFQFEGSHRMRTAEAGIDELQKYVDTLIIIPNQNLFRVSNENTTFNDAFKLADDVLYSGVRNVTDLMIIPGLINLDFADVNSVMTNGGRAMMGTGEAEGDNRSVQAAEAAISNRLLDESMKGAKGVLISITGGMDMTLFEVDEAANRIRDEVDSETNIIFGSTFDERLNGRIRVSVVATGINQGAESSYSGQATLLNTPKSDPISPGEELEIEEEEAFGAGNKDWVPATDQAENPQPMSVNIDIGPADSSQNEETEIVTDLGSDDLAQDEERQDDSSGQQAQVSELHRRPTLFERFSRSFRGRPGTQTSSTPVQGDVASVRVRKAGPVGDAQSNDENEVSDIPAFLRKQNKAS